MTARRPQERERQCELRRALRAAARRGRVEDAPATAAEPTAAPAAQDRESGREATRGGAAGAGEAGGEMDAERVRYLLAVQAVQQRGAAPPRGAAAPGRRIAAAAAAEGEDGPQPAQPPRGGVGSGGVMEDEDADALTRPAQQHFGADGLAGDADRAPPLPLTLCKGCGAALQGRPRGTGARMRVRFTCGECGIAFETRPHEPAPDEDEPAFHAPPGAGAGGGLVSSAGEGQTERGPDGCSAGAWAQWGLGVDASDSRGIMVSGRRRIRIVVESVAPGSIAAAAGVQVQRL